MLNVDGSTVTAAAAAAAERITAAKYMWRSPGYIAHAQLNMYRVATATIKQKSPWFSEVSKISLFDMTLIALWATVQK